MAAENEPIKQDEIEKLFEQAQSGGARAQPSAPEGAASSSPALRQDEIEALLSSSGKPQGRASDTGAAQRGDSSSESSKALRQEEIEALLNQPARQAVAAARSAPPAAEGSAGGEQQIAAGDVELLLSQAQQALASIDAPLSSEGVAAAPFKLHEFSGSPASSERATLELIRDVDLDLKIELGRTQMYLEDVLKLHKGSVVALDKLAGDPVDIYVNGRLIARGEVLVLNDNFCVRVAELIAAEPAPSG
jgi:flagellar motor switch protein FliN/FliY